MSHWSISCPLCTFCLLFNIVLLNLSSSSQATTLIDRVTNELPFAYEVLAPLYTNTTHTEAIATARDQQGNIFIVGNVLTKGSQLPPLVANVAADNVGKKDIILIKVSSSSTVAWARRTGSPSDDEATGIVVDTTGNVYICGYVDGLIGDNGSGAVVMKFNSAGQRLWVQTYGSPIGRERINAITLTDREDSLLATGEIASKSAMLTNTWNGGPGLSVLIARLSSRDGTLLQAAAAEALGDAFGSSGNAIVTKILSGSEVALICGKAEINLEGKRNGAVFSFALADLRQEGGRYIESSHKEEYDGIAVSNNNYSVYCVGSALISAYKEYDIRVVRFNISDLETGWAALLGSIEFDSFVSIRRGSATERGRDVVVDDFGNVYVLAESTSRLQLGHIFNTEIDALTNNRPAVVVFAPNGTVVDIKQSQRIDVVTCRSLTRVDDVLFVAGTRLNTSLKISQAVFGGMRISKGIMRKHADELVPVAGDGTDGDKDTDDNNNNGESNKKQKVAKWIIIAGAAGGLFLFIAFIVLLCALCKPTPSG